MKFCYIAGASSRAQTAKVYLEELYPDVKIRAFLVSPEMADNKLIVDGIPVKEILSDPDIDLDYDVYLGVRGVNQEKIANELIGIGFAREKIIPVTPTLDMELRNEYVKKAFKKAGRRFVKIDDLSEKNGEVTSKCIYVAKGDFDCEFDKPINLYDYERIIQVGSSIANKIIKADFYDNIGDNISALNRQFCELTALYWIWKHADSEVVGIEHWRRRFLLPDRWDRVMIENDIDVILPVPLCVMTSLKENFIERHSSKVWDKTMDMMLKYHQDDYDSALSFFKNSTFYSPCNMFVAQKQIIDDYCEWLFPMLIDLKDTIGTLNDSYQNRYPGFVAERLMNYFFEKNRDRYRIVYADKNFLK